MYENVARHPLFLFRFFNSTVLQDGAQQGCFAMLVLSRKTDERILLLVNGKQIEVMVTEIRNFKAKSVRLGITAPEDVVIIRPELLEEVKG
jgi:carbon storage regulator CsrA